MLIIKKGLVYYLLIFSILLSHAQIPTLKTGDFLFQDLDCGALCDAIENATFNNKNYKISHVGIVLIENDSIYVIEAYNGVSKTALKKFLNRSKTKNNKPKVVIARLKNKKYIANFIHRLKLKIGKPYDTEYRLNNDKYYCSELIYETLLDNNDKPIFSIKPMTFKNKITGKIDKAWITYFKDQNITIPEGELGSNPADYLLSNQLNVLFFYY